MADEEKDLVELPTEANEAGGTPGEQDAEQTADVIAEALEAEVEGVEQTTPRKPVIVGGKRKKKRRRKASSPVKKAQWYKMVAFFDGEAKSVMKVSDEDIVISGWVPPDNDCCVVLVPTSVTHQQGLALQKIIEAQTRKSVLVLTNNTQMVKLKPVSEGVAMKIMERGSGNGEVVQVQAGQAE